MRITYLIEADIVDKAKTNRVVADHGLVARGVPAHHEVTLNRRARGRPAEDAAATKRNLSERPRHITSKRGVPLVDLLAREDTVERRLGGGAAVRVGHAPLAAAAEEDATRGVDRRVEVQAVGLERV